MSMGNAELSGALLPQAAEGTVAERGPAGRREGWLFGPLVDFFCLGGGSLLALMALSFVVPTQELRVSFAVWAIAIAHLLNHPHFAHSYQIFYGGFRGKAFGDTFPPGLRRRYLFAGLVVPLLLAAFLATAVLTGDARLLGYAGNAMVFFVGWHYVKQGYGMAMLDAALKRRFFAGPEKRVLLCNAYVTWLTSWLLANHLASVSSFWGLSYYSVPVPAWLLTAAVALSAGSGAAALWMVLRKGAASGWRLPWNGLLAYAVTLYAWLVFIRVNPLFLLLVPAFHSLQYLVVVWRYQLNRTRAQPNAGVRPGDSGLAGRLPTLGTLRFGLFLVVGVAAGWLAFWGLPEWLGSSVPYDRAVFGPTLFIFCGWIFINLHHYFLDSVMWRRENPETRQHLFGAG